MTKSLVSKKFVEGPFRFSRSVRIKLHHDDANRMLVTIMHCHYLEKIAALRRSPPEGSLGRATYVLMRSVKTNKALLLERVTEPSGQCGERCEQIYSGKEKKK